MAKTESTVKGITGKSSDWFSPKGKSFNSSNKNDPNNSTSVGTYQESTGGGTPLKKGEKLKDHPEAKRVMQPRDADGKFTYNAANGKELKYKESRGDTVPPFLKGFKITYAIKKNTPVNVGGLIYLANINMTAEEFVSQFKEYHSDKGFGAIQGAIMQRKKGRKSQEEAQAVANNAQGIVAKKGENTITIKSGMNISSFQTMLSAGSTYRTKAQSPQYQQAALKNFVKSQKNNVSNNNNNNQQNTSSNASVQPDSKGINVAQAKDNPEDFLKDNYDAIDEIISLADSKGYDVDVDSLISSIASGQYKTFDDIKDQIK